MKRFVIKLVPFLLLIIVAASVRYYLKYDARYNYYNVSPRAISQSYVVVGDSKTLFGIDPQLVADLPFYNLSSWGARPLNTLNALAPYDLDANLILLSVSSRIFLQNDTLSNGHYNSVVHIFDYNLYTEAHQQLGHTSTGNWEYTLHPNGCLSFNQDIRSYAEYSATKDTTFYGNFMHASDRDYFVNIKLKHFVRLYQALSAKNKVILIDLPERATYNKMVAPFEEALYAAIKQQTGQEVIDFGTYDDRCFYDSHHMNSIGARQFTDTLKKMFFEDPKAR